MPKVVSSTLLCLFCQTVRYERARITEVNPCQFLSALPLPIATRFLHDGVTCALQISMFRTGLEQGLTARQDHFASLYRDGTDWTDCCCGIECGWGWRGLARAGPGKHQQLGNRNAGDRNSENRGPKSDSLPRCVANALFRF